ncbi:MAG: branched-chain amino acid ABC transporter permease [Burkholderiaceae bacterium]|nr:branched-chain amino acid ABC transporter permease [Burkholderiaceae bacterium]
MKFWIVSALAILSAVALALSGANEYLFFAGFVVLQAIILATGWNILGGYAGYVNFGVPGFVGVGAYTALALHLLVGAPLIVQIVAGAAMAALLGLAVGGLTLRLRGIFFSIATIAVVFILEAVVMNSRFLGGATGIQLTRPDDVWLFGTYTRMLFVMMTLMAVVALSVARYVQNSYIGQGLRAVRDAEEAAECSGVPTLKVKLIACAISGALLGVAGAPMPMYLSYIEPLSTFNLHYAVIALAMPIIGGTSHWIGPLIGALILGTLQQIVTVTISSELNVLVVGVLLVVFVVAAPDGVIGLVKKWKTSSK